MTQERKKRASSRLVGVGGSMAGSEYVQDSRATCPSLVTRDPVDLSSTSWDLPETINTEFLTSVR